MAFLRKLIRFAYWIMLFAAASQIPINTCPCVTQAGAGRRAALFSAVITALELAEEGAEINVPARKSICQIDAHLGTGNLP
jgi:hypothetical protein